MSLETLIRRVGLKEDSRGTRFIRRFIADLRDIYLGPKVSPAQAASGLRNYLRIEEALHEFFSKFDFCHDACFSKKYGVYSNRGDLGCCTSDYYLFTQIIPPSLLETLTGERERIYGLPTNSEEPDPGTGQPCSYHTPEGCILKTHKNPQCITQACRSFRRYIEKTYGIGYNHYKILYFCEFTLIGRKTDEQVNDFIGKIRRKTAEVVRLQQYSSVN